MKTIKTSKTFLGLTLSLLFLSNCSKEEISFDISEEETNIVDNITVAKSESLVTKKQESKSIIKDKTNSNKANRTDSGNNPTAPDLPEDPLTNTSSSSLRILVEYYGNVTELDKQTTRNTYGVSIGIISYIELDNDSDLWVVNHTLYTSQSPIPTCCPKVKSTEAESEDISTPDNWDDILLEASNTINANY
ncbi:hypothetical protein [Olleya namhaensis]|uniref:hypothetical protein n=1 Tax=Olleya namhaensis TaxID=1144750 RepID=UPI0023301AB5|nr:hypothetical protein [Olleya namhaensis]